MSTEALDKDVAQALAAWERKIRALHAKSIAASEALHKDVKFYLKEHNDVPKHLAEAILVKAAQRIDEVTKELSE